MTARKMCLPSEEVNASVTYLHQISSRYMFYDLKKSAIPSGISPAQIPWYQDYFKYVDIKAQ